MNRKQINDNAGHHNDLAKQILGIDWYDTESQARKVIEWMVETVTWQGAQQPGACYYGRENGDGTYTPTYERWPLPTYVTPYKGMPIKLFYPAPQPALTEAVHTYFRVIDDNNAGVIDRLNARAALRKAAGIAAPNREEC